MLTTSYPIALFIRTTTIAFVAAILPVMMGSMRIGSLTLKIHDLHLLGSIEHFDYQRVDSKDAKEQEYQYYFPFVLTMRLIVTPFKSIFLTRNYNLSHFTIIEVNRVF